jgi:hypothetical protein
MLALGNPFKLASAKAIYPPSQIPSKMLDYLNFQVDQYYALSKAF